MIDENCEAAVVEPNINSGFTVERLKQVLYDVSWLKYLDWRAKWKNWHRQKLEKQITNLILGLC